MNSKITKLIITSVLLSSIAHAGDSVLSTQSLSTASAPEPWLVPSLNVRARYEFGNAQALDPSHALTVRVRPGLTIQKSGFSAFAELESTLAAVDDYDAAGDNFTNPDRPNNTQINDPENTEINQLFLRYRNEQHQFTVGRQRLIFDNAAHVGNVGWRQNEQTFDAAHYQYRVSKLLTFQYAYANRVNRIFGHEAPYPLSHFNGSIHLANLNFTVNPNTSIGAYYYSTSFEKGAAGLGNHTTGMHVSTKAKLAGQTFNFRQENAWQTSRDGAALDYNVWYNHTTLSTSPKQGHTLALGYERLGDGDGTSFRAPLSTAHAFNGYADAFVGTRIAGTSNGLSDLYISYKLPLAEKLKAEIAYHHFRDADMETSLGNEIDFVLKRSITPQLSAVAKAAYYQAPDNTLAVNDITRFTLELNYTF